MLLQYHKNCIEEDKHRPHKPEIEVEVSSFKAAVQEIKKAKVEAGYLDWGKPNHYIVYQDRVVDYTDYKEKVITRTFKP